MEGWKLEKYTIKGIFDEKISEEELWFADILKVKMSQRWRVFLLKEDPHTYLREARKYAVILYTITCGAIYVSYWVFFVGF